MNWVEIAQLWLMAFLTLALFSFMYKDNPFYKVAEHIFAGMTAGYYVGLIWHSVILQQLWDPMLDGRWWLFVPGLLGVLMFSRFTSKYSWISRIPLAFVMAVTAGVFLTTQLHGLVLPQMRDTMVPATKIEGKVADTFSNNIGELSVFDSGLPVPDTLNADSSVAVLTAVKPDSSAVVSGEGEQSLKDSVSGSMSIMGSVVQPSRNEVDRLGHSLVELSAEIADNSPLGMGEFYAISFKLRPTDLSGAPMVVAQSHMLSDDGISVTTVNGQDGLKKLSVSFDLADDLPTGRYDLSVEVERHSVIFTLAIIVVVGVISTLIYFYFSKPHTGALGITAKVGIWFIMISFGAHFGYTVMGRVSLLIGRVQFLIVDWIGSFTS